MKSNTSSHNHKSRIQGSHSGSLFSSCHRLDPPRAVIAVCLSLGEGTGRTLGGWRLVACRSAPAQPQRQSFPMLIGAGYIATKNKQTSASVSVCVFDSMPLVISTLRMLACTNCTSSKPWKGLWGFNLGRQTQFSPVICRKKARMAGPTRKHDPTCQGTHKFEVCL